MDLADGGQGRLVQGPGRESAQPYGVWRRLMARISLRGFGPQSHSPTARFRGEGGGALLLDVSGSKYSIFIGLRTTLGCKDLQINHLATEILE
jgi:hypothetical protein